MKNLTAVICLTLAVILGNVGHSHALQKRVVEIYLTNQLDDERGFCVDIKGHKTRAKIDRGLQAHTCYSYQGSIHYGGGDGLAISADGMLLVAYSLDQNTIELHPRYLGIKCFKGQ